MHNIYTTFIEPILTNQIVVNWIAPIITGLIVFFIPIILSKFIRNRALIKNIQETNNKIIDTIRPFIIQRIEINSKFISNIRDAIIKESNIKSKFIATEIEIRNKLLLDISETRFLKENEKQDLIDFIYSVFKDFNEKNIETSKNKEESKINIDLNISKILSTITLFFSLILMLIAYKLNPVNTNIEDNIVIILTMISSIISLCYLVIGFMGIGDIYNKSIFDTTHDTSIRIKKLMEKYNEKK